MDENPPFIDADERESLCAFLDYLRECVVRKVGGVEDDAAARQMVPSGTSILWLITHLTAVEINQFQRMFAGRAESELVPLPPPSDDQLELAVTRYQRACDESRSILATTADLATMAAGKSRRGHQATLRWTLLHTIEETARHLGHLDILREELDGATGR
jgi:hypothetical protein